MFRLKLRIRRLFKTLFWVWPLFNLLSIIVPSHAQIPSKKVYMTMEEAIERALSQNNQVRASEFAVKRASWDRKNAWMQLLPNLSLNSRMTRIDDETFAQRDFRRYMPPEIAKQIPQTVFQQSYYTSFDVTVPLFDSALLNGLLITRANENMAQQLKESTRQNIIFQVISSYLNVLQGKEIFRLQEDYLELSKRNYEKAERLYRAGRYSKTDALRWKVEYQQQKGVVVENASILRSDMTHLNRLLNRSMHELIEIEGQIPQKLLSESETLTALSDVDILNLIPKDDESLIRANSALSAARSGEETSKYLYRNSYVSYLPNVSASYSYGWRENNTLALDDYSPTMFMVNLSVPVFTSFRNFTNLKSSYYEYKQSQEEFQDQLKNTRYVLTEIVNQIINLKTQKELSKTNTEYSEHNYRVVAQQKEKGLVSNIDFIDAKLNLQNAKLDDVNTHYDFITAMVELYYVLGKINSIIE